MHNVYKLGRTQNIPERNSTYTTGEFIKGYFILVLQMTTHNDNYVEKLLHKEFKHLRKEREFFDCTIKYVIRSYLISKNINCIELNSQAIVKLSREYRLKKILPNVHIYIHLINTIKKIFIKRFYLNYLNKEPPITEKYSPRDYQIEIIEKAYTHYIAYDKGLLVLICGIGKTLISLFIAKEVNAQSIIIGVPNKLLLKQWMLSVYNVFGDIPQLSVCDTIIESDISNFIKTNITRQFVIITTYASSHKLDTIMAGRQLDIKILDEVHHLTSTNKHIALTKESYIRMLNIQTKKQIGLTATMKIIDDRANILESHISNNNEEIFGTIIDKKALLWGIQHNIVCDYYIQTFILSTSIINDIYGSEDGGGDGGIHANMSENDMRLFLSAFISLKSIDDGHSHHILIYANSLQSSGKIIAYINNILSNSNYTFLNINVGDIYISTFDGEMSLTEQEHIIKEFKYYKFGIISCVYCLGEGWDFPLLDATVFAENMTSDIRILQSALRAGRKDINNIGKIFKIILPILYQENWMDSGYSDFKKVREVIYQMGLEDETITHKIKVFDLVKAIHSGSNKGSKSIIYNIVASDQLSEQLRLKTINRIALMTTYTVAKKIIANKNICSKEEYYSLCDNDYRLDKDPETLYGGTFNNWIDYLSIGEIYYNIDMCKIKITEFYTANGANTANGTNTANGANTQLQKCKKNDDLEKIIIQLKQWDCNFPSVDLFVDYYQHYYNINNLYEVILSLRIKKTKVIKF
jgi:superfamily II DNA or RNA helicase